MHLFGHCMCGSVTWAAKGTPTRNIACHCTDCQRATSSPFTAFIGLIPDDVVWTGEINHFQSTPGTYRGFCPKCGTRLYFKSTRWPGEIHIHAATLADPEGYTPDVHSVLASSPKWLKLNDDIPKNTGFDAPMAD